MDTLAAIPLFKEMDTYLSERHARSCFFKDFDQHEMIIDVEDETTDVRFVLSGKVRVIHRIAIGKEVILGEMGEGGFFGEIAAVDGVDAGRTAPEEAPITAEFAKQFELFPIR